MFIYPPIYKQLQTFISQYEKSLKVSNVRSSIPSAQQDPPPGNGGVSSTNTGKSSTSKIQISPFFSFLDPIANISFFFSLSIARSRLRLLLIVKPTFQIVIPTR